MQGWQQGGPVDNTEGVLRRAPLFDALDDEGARTLRRQMAEVKLSRGEHLFMEGDDGDALYGVIEGKMKLTRAAQDGRENLLSVIGPGEMFGELSLFDPRPRTSSASAVTDAVLASLKHEALMPWFRERRPSVRGRPWPGRQEPARPRRPLRQPGGGRTARASRPHPGRAGTARRRLTRDGQQGTGRLRGEGLAADLGPL